MISSIVLAAGSATRMGRQKLFAALRGRPVLDLTLSTVRRSSAGEIVLVTSSDLAVLEKVTDLEGVKVVKNDEPGAGMSGSIKIGVAASSINTDGFLFVLGDQPLVSYRTMDELMRVHKESRAAILVPTLEGWRGNPVLVDVRLRPEIQRLKGDQGCRALFGLARQRLVEVPVDDAGILIDIDTEEQLGTIENALNQGLELRRLVHLVSRHPASPGH